jgi:phage shock protein A
MFVRQDKLETKIKDEVKALEDTVNQLEEKLSKKKAENQPQAASTPLRVVLPQSEQVSHAILFLQRAA